MAVFMEFGVPDLKTERDIKKSPRWSFRGFIWMNFSTKHTNRSTQGNASSFAVNGAAYFLFLVRGHLQIEEVEARHTPVVCTFICYTYIYIHIHTFLYCIYFVTLYHIKFYPSILYYNIYYCDIVLYCIGLNCNVFYFSMLYI